MRRIVRIGVIVWAWAAVAGVVSGQPVEGFRGDFEAAGEGQNPAGWATHTWGGQAQFLRAEGRTGGSSVRVSSESGADAGWYARVPVRPGASYVLSGWIRTEGVELAGGRGVVFNLHGRPEHTDPLKGTNGWTRVEVPFEAGADDEVQVNCCFGFYGLAKGTAWFDDLSVVMTGSKDVRAEVTVDAAQPREALSKYVYSQFIEHLGRCIYGGIWAEVVEDRKFFWPVGAGESPWRAVGGTVAMDVRDALTGDHSARVEGPAGSGVEQGGVELRGGVDYVGSVWVKGGAGAGPVAVTLAWEGGSAAAELAAPGAAWGKAEFRLTGVAAAKGARVRVSKGGAGPLWVGAVSLMPADHVRGMRRDTLEQLKELNAPLYRWPGGNFVSGYEWRDGIGDRDRRPTRKNPAWRGIDSNDFGVHEFMDFCREVGAEPLVVVNTGFGDSYSAAQWVEYMNGGEGTPMGSWRMRNGHPDPYGVVWWGVGNEMWGGWQLGHMALDQYVIKHNDFVKRMRRVDPRIRVVGSSDLGGGWTEGMLKGCAGSMDLISEHFYCQERPGVAGHAAQVPRAIRAKVEAHRDLRKRLPELKGKDVRIAMDEWNYWYGPEVFGELGTRYFWKDALGIAEGIHEYARSTDIVFMANYAQTVNVIGCVKTTGGAAWMETTGQVLTLYRKRFGTLPVPVTGEMGLVDVAAAWTADRKEFTVAVVNPTAEDRPVKVSWKGVALGEGTSWTMRSADPMAFNDAGKAAVKVEEARAAAPGEVLTAPGYSVTLWRWGVK